MILTLPSSEYQQKFLISSPIRDQVSFDQHKICYVQSADKLSDRADQLIETISPHSPLRLTIICDEITHGVLAAKIKKILSTSHSCNSIILPTPLSADIKFSQQIIAEANDSELLIAVGSGTINDLVKYAATQLKIPYVVFATAPSMNGYCSASVSLIDQGLKKSIPANPPRAAFFDLAILSRAPQKMIAAGLADCLCRSTVQTDWLFSHFLVGTPYHQEILNPLIDLEKRVIASVQLLRDGNQNAHNDLVQLIVHSGIGMAVVGNSNPASQAEHMIAHYIDTQGDSVETSKFLHGEIIAVTTLTMAALQEKILSFKQLKFSAEFRYDHAWFTQVFGQEKATEYWKVFQEKQFSCEKQSNYQHKLTVNWPEWRIKIQRNRLSHQLLSHMFKTMGLPTQPEHLNLRPELYQKAVKYARFTRNRLTFLDLAAWVGLLP